MPNKIKEKKQLIFEKENSPVPFVLRFIALLVDSLSIIILSFLLFLIANASPIGSSLKGLAINEENILNEIKLRTGYGEKTILTEENEDKYKDYITYIDDDNTRYVVTDVENVGSGVEITFEQEVNNSNAYHEAAFKSAAADYGVLCLVLALSETALLLVVPLTNKRRATCGGLITNTLCFNPNREVKANKANLIGRLIFVFLVETALPLLIMGELLLVFVPLAKIIIIAISKERRCLSDYISHTMHIHKDNYYSVVEEKINNGEKEA